MAIYIIIFYINEFPEEHKHKISWKFIIINIFLSILMIQPLILLRLEVIF